MSDKSVRIFVSSPADVDHERAAVKDIIDQLSREYLPYFELRAILWEEEALTADRTFQAGLTQPEDCDIVLVILWTRLGSPLPQEPYRGMTGTEWEFVNAVEASAQQGSPEVLVYKKTAPKLVDITDASLAREAVEDRRRLEAFFQAHFFFDDNSFRRAFRTFDNATAFRDLVATQLRKLLNRRISAERRAISGDLHWQGSPFRPGRPFEIGDQRIFTGREQEARDLLQHLDRLSGDDASFLLVTGPSGSGKTSLLRAGVLSRLTRPFQFDEIASIRACLVDPTAATEGPLAALASALCSAAVLGEPLAGFGLDASALKRLLTSEPELAAQQIGSAMAVAPSGPSSSDGNRLLLLLDPLEPVVEQASDDELQALARALRALAEAATIWVIAVLRSDAVPTLERLPALQPLIQEHNWIDIGPPSSVHIRQMVEIPARIAGIELDANEGDEHNERELVAHIEADADRIRLWPPLLQPVLDRIYQQAVERQTLTSGELQLSGADYRASGGIKQYVLAQAERVWAELDDDARAALPRLCRGLLTLEGGAIGRPTTRAGSLDLLRRDPACARLIQRLIEARLLVAEGQRDATLSIHCEPPDYRLRAELAAILRQTRQDWGRRWRRLRGAEQEPQAGPISATAKVLAGETGPAAAGDDAGADAQQPDWRGYRAVISFSHPILLTHWPPVRDWLGIMANRQFLARRFQLDRQAQLWKRTNCNREYLLRDAGSAKAQGLSEAYADELEPLEREFLAQSSAQIAFLRRRSLLVRAVGIVLAGLMLLSSISAGIAYRAYADSQANLARSKLNEASLAIARGNTPQAIDLALSAGTELPQRAVQTLGLAFSSNRLIAMTSAASPSLDDQRVPGFSADGSQVASFLPDQGPTLLELEHGRLNPKQALGLPEPDLHSLFFGADDQVFGIGTRGIWRLPAGPQADPDYACGTTPGLTFRLDHARERVALSRDTADGRHGLCVVDLNQPGRIILDQVLDDGPIRSLSFSPGGEALLTAAAGGRTRLIDLSSGEIRLSLPADKATGRPFDRAVFDARGELIAIASADERVRLYRRDGEPIAELSSARIGGREFKLHRSAVRDVAFDPSGSFLVSTDDEGQVVRWTLGDGMGGEMGAAATGERIFDQAVVLNSHRLSAETVRIIDPPAQLGLDEGLVLSASLDGTVKLTGLQTGKSLAVLGHDAAITAAGFLADGEQVASFSVRDGTARLWSVTPISRIAYKLRHPDHVWSVDTATAPPAIAQGTNTLLLATAGYDGGVRVWRYARDDASSRPKRWAEFIDEADARPVRQVRFSASGRYLASAHNDGTARVFDLIDKRRLCEFQVTDSDLGQVYNALFSEHGNWLLTTSNDPSDPVRAFSLDSCTALNTEGVLAHDKQAIDAATILDTDSGSLIATGDAEGMVQLAERSIDGRWRLHCRAQAGVGGIGDLALSPDGRQLAVAGGANRAALIRLKPFGADPASEPSPDDCGQTDFLEGHSGRIYSIAFAPDGKQLVTASLDKTARIWSAQGAPIAVLAGHQDRIYRAEFSPDGHWLLTGSRDGSIRVWKRPTRSTAQVEVLSTFLPLEADAGGVANAVFSPDGHYIAGAYWENAAILWRLWAEDTEADEPESARWGPDRSQLALVKEAYRFRRDNKVTQDPFDLAPLD